MNKKLLLLAITAVVAVAAILAGRWWTQAGQTQAAVIAWLPDRPNDVSSLPPAFETALNETESRARSRHDAMAGLADLGILYHANGFFAPAIRCYEALTALDPTNPRWPHRHASILAGFGQIGEALDLWERVTELAPDYVPARLRIGDSALKTNDTTSAVAAYEAAMEIDSLNAYALLGLARVDYEADRLDEAKRRLEAVVRRTNYNLGYDLIVSVYERLGETSRAEAIRGQAEASGAYRDPPDPWLDELMDHCYDPFRLALEAGVKARNNDPAAAIVLLERAIALTPDDVSAHFQLANLHRTQRNYPAAMEGYRRCTVLDPEFADGWAQLSGVLNTTNNSAEAARVLAAGLEACPDSPGLHRMHARALRAAGQNGAAIGEYRTSIRLRPNEPESYLELATLLIEMERVPEGIAQVRAALVTDPANPTALPMMAFHAIDAGHRPEADRWLERAAAQPRIDRQQLDRIQEAYERAFGPLPTR